MSGLDTQTHTHTHRATTVTLAAHARRGLITLTMHPDVWAEPSHMTVTCLTTKTPYPRSSGDTPRGILKIKLEYNLPFLPYSKHKAFD